jgi:site-specific DNA recombinase
MTRITSTARSRAQLAIVPEQPPNVATYVRLSQDRSGNEVGIDTQLTACAEVVRRAGWEMPPIERQFSDNDTSAYRRDKSGRVRRTGYEALLAAIDRGEVDALVVYHSDRLYRRMADLERLVDAIERNQVDVRTAAAGVIDLTTASGRMTARILASVAQHESERIGERVAMAHERLAEAGSYQGGPRPYGYRIERIGEGKDAHSTLAIVPAEAAEIRKALRMVLGGSSIRAIAIDFNRRGVPTVRGGSWKAKSLADMLRSPRIIGARAYRGDIVATDAWPAIVKRADWERAQALMAHNPVGPRPRVSLLAGFLRCGRCGARLYTEHSRAYKGGPPRRLYACRPDHDGCGKLTIEAAAAEQFITGTVIALAHGIDLSDRRTEHLADIAAEVERDERELADLARQFAERRISRAEWQAFRDVADERLARNRALLAERTPAKVARIADVGAEWPNLDLDARRAIVDLFIRRIVIKPAAKQSNRVDVSRIEVELRS